MKTGKVLWFDAVKGYGFIAQDDKSEDIFVHFRSIKLFKNERVELQKEQRVSYEVAEGEKGQHAINVSVL
ncbi:MAG: cold-shock protein [Thiovulaceae bacterium]|jgi:CspA family cold shock protein|nr:cold-shock protein [Sulfurimonadaceae bacterium]MDD3816719.1 cold-shock protein [Sulfurimonadaceae bacterium]